MFYVKGIANILNPTVNQAKFYVISWISILYNYNSSIVLFSFSVEKEHPLKHSNSYEVIDDSKYDSLF